MCSCIYNSQFTTAAVILNKIDMKMGTYPRLYLTALTYTFWGAVEDADKR